MLCNGILMQFEQYTHTLCNELVDLCLRHWDILLEGSRLGQKHTGYKHRGRCTIFTLLVCWRSNSQKSYAPVSLLLAIFLLVTETYVHTNTYTQTPIWRHPRLVFVKVREQKFLIMQYFDLPPPSIYCQKLRRTTSGTLSGLFLSLFTPWRCIEGGSRMALFILNLALDRGEWWQACNQLDKSALNVATINLNAPARNLQNIKHKLPDQPVEKRATPYRIHV
jgi:hypothetical protein